MNGNSYLSGCTVLFKTTTGTNTLNSALEATTRTEHRLHHEQRALHDHHRDLIAQNTNFADMELTDTGRPRSSRT